MAHQIFILTEIPAFSAALAKQLKPAGLAAIRVESCQSFMDKYDVVWSGCIVLDIQLPGPLGLKVQRHRIRTACQMPVIFASTEGDQVMGVQALVGEQFVTFESPLAGKQLVNQIGEALAWHAQYCEEKTRWDEARTRYARLTKRDKDIFDATVQGLSTKETAAKLGISPRTVEIYRSRVFAKMTVRSAAELTRLSLKLRK